ncbi:alpha-ketoglutarate-dependent dioxygenase alkB homolog 6 [Agrilus planipennis]|uniref:Alpha-ketoglutarate-dependent dioxygenase alkB homolog 6 n=1 Tax=Agrilus planipennis TaxID=224129 RepID=A0A7F5R9K3_AGRPL|nr:alpha-ketoglutarate-dependent dioxygenase alkB homolog 6 [Agrilus planipennis]
MNTQLEKHIIKNIPPTVYYIPDFITPEEEQHILKNVYSVPKPKWTSLSHRRLQDYGGVPHKNGMIVEDIPSWLQVYMDKVTNLNIFGDKSPNHVLVNEYLSNQGIMPHTDGPLFHSMVTTISCGSHTMLEILENNDKREKVCDILLENRSLVIFTDKIYIKYLHGIREMERDEITGEIVNLDLCKEKYEIGQVLERQTRVSLTIRHVPKVLKIKLCNLQKR